MTLCTTLFFLDFFPQWLPLSPSRCQLGTVQASSELSAVAVSKAVEQGALMWASAAGIPLFLLLASPGSLCGGGSLAARWAGNESTLSPGIRQPSARLAVCHGWVPALLGCVRCSQQRVCRGTPQPGICNLNDAQGCRRSPLLLVFPSARDLKSRFSHLHKNIFVLFWKQKNKKC